MKFKKEDRGAYIAYLLDHTGMKPKDKQEWVKASLATFDAAMAAPAELFEEIENKDKKYLTSL